MQGHLTEEQRDTLKGVIAGRTVYDLGAGTCALSHLMLDLGASEIIAIDRNPVSTNRDGLTFKQAYFHELDPIEDGVAFVSWPQQYIPSLVRLVQKAPSLVYLGCNTDMSACGPTGLWEYVQGRSLDQHVPHKRNTLLVYGDLITKGSRDMVLEERAGLDRSRVYYYDEEYDNG